MVALTVTFPQLSSFFCFHKIVIMYFAWNSEFLETERQRKAVTCDVVCHQGKEMRKMRLKSEEKM